MKELVGPRNEVFPVRRVGVSAVMLSPGKVSIEHGGIDRRHFCGVVALLDAPFPGPKQPEDRLRSNSGHETALMIEPTCVAFLGDPIADESETRGAEGQQLVGVDR